MSRVPPETLVAELRSVIAEAHAVVTALRGNPGLVSAGVFGAIEAASLARIRLLELLIAQLEASDAA